MRVLTSRLALNIQGGGRCPASDTRSTQEGGGFALGECASTRTERLRRTQDLVLRLGASHLRAVAADSGGARHSCDTLERGEKEQARCSDLITARKLGFCSILVLEMLMSCQGLAHDSRLLVKE